MNRIAFTLSLTTALLSLAACGSDKPAPGGAASAAPAATTGGTKAAEITCDAIVGKMETLAGQKMDADGKKLFSAMCEKTPQAVRACMMASKTTKDFDACDPRPAKSAASAAPSAAAAPVEMIEHDLSTADPAWKGWVAKGPKDAKVMADGVKGARIAANGLDAFDLAFSATKTKLSDTKKGMEAAKKGVPDMKITYVTDTADKLEWVTEIGGTKTYAFSWNMKASGKDVTCSSGPRGASSEAALATLKSACDTLKKK